MIGTGEGYWYSYDCLPMGMACLTIHHWGNEVTEPFVILDEQVDEVFGLYLRAERKRRER